jgi:hypothetical protein
LSRHFEPFENRLPALGLAGTLLVLLSIVWINLAGLGLAQPENIQYYLLVLGASFVIGILSVLLVYLTWSWQAAQTGLVWGLLMGFLLYTVANTFGVSQVRPNHPAEFWNPAPLTRHAGLFLETVEGFALSETGNRAHLEVESLVDSPSFQWAMRKIEGVRYVQKLDPEDLPGMIVTTGSAVQGPRQDMYRGQEFGWWDSPGWAGALPTNWARWLTAREAPILTEKIVLWVRLDLFPMETGMADAESELIPFQDGGVEEGDQ